MNDKIDIDEEIEQMSETLNYCPTGKPEMYEHDLSWALELLRKQADRIAALTLDRDGQRNALNNVVYAKGLEEESIDQAERTAMWVAKERIADLDHCEDECMRLRRAVVGATFFVDGGCVQMVKSPAGYDLDALRKMERDFIDAGECDNELIVLGDNGKPVTQVVTVKPTWCDEQVGAEGRVEIEVHYEFEVMNREIVEDDDE